MKKIQLLFVLALAFLSSNVLAQSNTFNYQAAVRDASGEILANQSVTIDFSVLEGSAVGTEVYNESHTVTTNDQGLVNVVIGTGTVSTGIWNSISWSESSYFLNVTLDGTDLGTSKFESVPYANSAITALNGINQFSIDSTLRFINNASGQAFFIKEAADGKLKFVANNTTGAVVMTLDDDGVNGVGIGTEDPTEKLEVNGAVKITEVTSTPAPNTFYGNSGPLAYGQISGTTVATGGYGITSVTNAVAGTFIVTLDNSWVGNPAVSITAYNASPDTEIGTYQSLGPNQIEVNFVDENNNAVNTVFSIIVYGTAQ